MANRIRSVLYVRVTSQLSIRVDNHKNGIGSQFTSKYKCIDLIYYKGFPFIVEAIKREKQMKKWKRDWKMNVIRELNPNLDDLSSIVFKERL